MDIYVGNETTNNRSRKNNSKGFFKDVGLVSGTAINIDEIAESSMGIALGDVDRGGFQDLIISHFSMETNTIYQKFGNLFFSDMTLTFGMMQFSFMNMGWGTMLEDVNNNGFEDIIVANGHINDFINEADSRSTYNQINQIFLNNNSKKFDVVKAKDAFSPIEWKSTRGLAMADWNSDGKIDLAFNSVNTLIEVFENTIENDNA